MSTISNKFFVQVIEDGTTLHGQLIGNPTPTQAYKDGVYVPDWATTASARPLIYLSLLDGATPIYNATGTWYYNGTAITFSTTTSQETIGGTTYSGYVSTNFNGAFFLTSYNQNPAIGIIKNLASSSNVNIDVIRFDGQIVLTTNPVNFSASINITITQWMQGGFVGVLSFPNGTVITDAIQSVSVNAILYNDSGVVNLDSGDYKWFRDGVDTTTPWKIGSSITVLESDVTDYMMLRCEFYKVLDGQSAKSLVYTAYAGIDDQQDPEYMWITYNGGDGNSASLRSGEDVEYTICVGKADDPTPNTDWKHYKLKVLDSEGNVVLDTVSGTSDFTYLAAADENGFRLLTPAAGSQTGEATAKLTYDDVFTLCKKGMTGVIVASTTAFT